jgi:hypothetical protein
MGKQLDTEIIKGDPDAVLSVAPAFDRKSSAETIRGAAGIIVEEDNQIYNTAGIELSLEGSAAGNMIKTAAKIKKSQMLSIVLMETLRLKPSCHARLFKHSFHRSSRERPSND